MAYKISKEDMAKELAQGKTVAQIGREYGISKSMADYIAHKYGLESNFTKHIKARRADDRFNKIECKETAYIVGFLLGDGYLYPNNIDYIDVIQCIKDKAVIEWMANYLNAPLAYDYTTNPSKRRYPVVKLRTKINYISKYLGTCLKPERHYPIVSQKFEPYLLRGLFDADGAILGGVRKDRNEFWWRLIISHHQKCLEGVQSFLYKRLDIPSTVRQRTAPRTDFTLQINKKKAILDVMDYMYADTDFIPFTRKYDKYIAMRLESDKFMEKKKNALLNHEPIKE